MNGCLARLSRGSAPGATLRTGMERSEDKKAIYCLMVNEEVLYVGSTKHPRERFVSHGRGCMIGRDFSMVLLRWCPSDQAERIESQVIRAYWRRGMAELNLITPLSFREPLWVRIKPTAERKRGTSKSDSIRGALISYGGKSLTLSEWALALGIDKKTLEKRLERGWTVERALKTDVQRRSWQ